MATFLDAAGVPYPTSRGEVAVTPLEGESLLPVLKGELWQRERPIYWEHEGNRAVREGRWKLVSKHPGAWELYDMIVDRTELNDLGRANKPQTDEMVAAYEAWATRCGVRAWPLDH
jgi:arylsulfatase